MKRQVITYTIAFIGLIVVGLFFYIMTGRVERKLAFIVDGMELSGRTELTIGKNSDVCFNRIPHDFITIKREGDYFKWKVNDDYRDSLQYYKINNINPNKHSIRNDKQQKISFTFPPYTVDKKDTLHLTLTGEEVWNLWEKFQKQVDVLSRCFSVKYILEKQGCSSADSLKWLAQLQNGAVRSFFHKKDSLLDIVILDRYTSVDDTIQYVREGHTSAQADTARHCKLQFFGISDYCYRCEEPDYDYFQIDGVNYVMKPYVKTTEWGSGHTMVTYTGTGLKVCFPRPVTFVVSVDSLIAQSKFSSGIITIKQDNDAIPAKGDMYLPKFSNAINFDLCNIEFFHQDDSITLRDNNYKESRIGESKLLVPTFPQFILHSGDDKLSVRAGLINQSFVISYIWLPLIVFVALQLLIWLPISPFKVKYSQDLLYNKDRIQNYPIYLSFLLFICLAYCCCKSLIALKLSYTYPYFEKLTGIISMSTAMMMLLFFSLTMILNTPLLHLKKTWRLWSGWGICVALFVFVGYCFFSIMDSQISGGVILSYLPSEIYTYNIFRWLETGAIQDTHRSVIYALLAVESLLLTLWFLMNFFWEWMAKVATWCYPESSKWQIVLFVIRQLVCLSLIFFVGIIGGNFGTAVITLLVILGICDALSFLANQLTKKGERWVKSVLIGMFSATIFYIIDAFWSDFGYITNYFGFFLFFCFIFFMVKRPDPNSNYKTNESLIVEKKWFVGGIIVVCTIVAISIPVILYWCFDTEKVDYARYTRRAMLYADFNALQKSGYRYHESDAEFMVIMSHYMQNNDGQDPLSNDKHALHASISSGQSPVVLNDLSVPVAFIGTYGWMATFVFFTLLAILAWLVMRYSMDYANENYPKLTTAMQWRILAMLMWISTSLYIYLSYQSWLPFTGRLNPGYGIDAVGEALETAILLAFMASVTCEK